MGGTTGPTGAVPTPASPAARAAARPAFAPPAGGRGPHRRRTHARPSAEGGRKHRRTRSRGLGTDVGDRGPDGQPGVGPADGYRRGGRRSSSRVSIRVSRSLPASMRSRLASMATRRSLRCRLASDMNQPNTTARNVKPGPSRLPGCRSKKGQSGAVPLARSLRRSRRRVSSPRPQLRGARPCVARRSWPCRDSTPSAPACTTPGPGRGARRPMVPRPAGGAAPDTVAPGRGRIAPLPRWRRGRHPVAAGRVGEEN